MLFVAAAALSRAASEKPQALAALGEDPTYAPAVVNEQGAELSKNDLSGRAKPWFMDETKRPFKGAEHVCVSTSVTLKSQWCERACMGSVRMGRFEVEHGRCPDPCLCIDMLLGTAQHKRMSRGVLLKLASQLKSTSAADRPAAMHQLREDAHMVVNRLATKLRSRADDKDGPTCTSTQEQISDEWCETNYLSFPLYCACEDPSDDGEDGAGSSTAQQQEEQAITKPPVAWTSGYYSWSWTNPAIPAENGTEDSTLGVQFSGEWNVTAALLAVGAISAPCDATQKTWCESQLDFYKGDSNDEDEAKGRVLQEFGENCRSCVVTKADLSSTAKAKAWAHPFSEAAGTYRGKQYLSLGGSRSIEAWRTEFLDGFVDGGSDIAAIKTAGFVGVCFDIEETNGGKDLIKAFERAFRVLKKAGLEVMITTSHSAPYSAETDEIRIGFVESWVTSDDIDIISPQLYTSGAEGKPEFEPSSGTYGPVQYDRYKKAKARFVPSVGTAAEVDEVKEFFEKKGIRVDGFVQWQPSRRTAAPVAPTAPGAAEVPSAPV
jgi:hypothetical protein